MLHTQFKFQLSDLHKEMLNNFLLSNIKLFVYIIDFKRHLDMDKTTALELYWILKEYLKLSLKLQEKKSLTLIDP